MSQSRNKATRQLDVQGPWAPMIRQAMRAAGGRVGGLEFSAEARYLGPYLSVGNGYDGELVRRVAKLEVVFRM